MSDEKQGVGWPVFEAGADEAAVAEELAAYLDEVDAAVEALCTPEYVAAALERVLRRVRARDPRG